MPTLGKSSILESIDPTGEQDVGSWAICESSRTLVIGSILIIHLLVASILEILKLNALFYYA